MDTNEWCILVIEIEAYLDRASINLTQAVSLINLKWGRVLYSGIKQSAAFLVTYPALHIFIHPI